MTLREAVSICLSKYATFSGRARRSEFWMANLAFFLALMAWGILGMITRWEIIRFLGTLFLLACLLPLWTVQVRRLHDVGRSGLWLLIGAIPFGSIVTFVFSCLDSEPFTNKYGPPPKPVPYPYLPGAGPLPPAPTPVVESDLPFFQARRNAAQEASGRQRHESGEPTLGSHKVDEYFVHPSGQEPARDREPKPAFSFSTMSRKSLGLVAGGIAVAILVLGIFLGANSWRPSAQDSVLAAAPAPQPALASAAQPEIPTQQVTPSPSTTAQATVPAAAVAAPPPPLPTQSAAPQPGDLGLTSPLRPVECTGQFIVVYHSSVIPSAYAQDVQTNLSNHPGSKYLLTAGSCSSLTPMSSSGTMIYAVYGGPFDTLAAACVAASRFSDEAYVKVLNNVTPPDQSVRPCP